MLQIVDSEICKLCIGANPHPRVIDALQRISMNAPGNDKESVRDEQGPICGARPSEGPDRPGGAWLSERLVSAVRKTLLKTSIRGRGPRHSERPRQE